MTTRLGKRCSFGLLCVSFVNVYQFVCALLSHLVSRVGLDLIVFIPDYCLSIYFTATDPWLNLGSVKYNIRNQCEIYYSKFARDQFL